MYLHSYRLKNYRRLREVHIELAADISIFVGANNSGKTSATQAIQTFLAGAKDRFSLFDFSSHTWKELDAVGAMPPENDLAAVLPTISLDLWFEVTANDLHLVLPILPSTAWQGTQVGIRIEFAPANTAELMHRFRAATGDGQARAAALEGGAGSYLPWPKNLSDYLQRELKNEYELHYYVLDRTQFDASFIQNAGYAPLLLIGEPSGASILRSLVRVDSLNAQRHLADPSAVGSADSGRAEDLSKRLSRFYQRNLDQRQEDHSALKALFESERGLDKHLAEVFGPTLKRLERLGYPGLNNPRLEIRSALNPASIMTQDARVHYVLGRDGEEVVLPDSYNGLGFKNLIYMVVEILDLQAKWLADEDKRPPLHLIFIEEPEAHLHAQLQQVFIRNVLGLLRVAGEENGAFCSQVVITTHSPHILYERGFQPIRYFKRHVVEAEQSTEVLNLSAFHAMAGEDRDFLARYLKLTHCDLFFADAAVLVEGNVERLLLPLMIEKEAHTLRSASICILEVGGAYGHRFKGLIEFLGITTLLITDIDSVETVDDAQASEDDTAEFEVPGENAGDAKQVKKGKACLPGVQGCVTSNQTLIQWLPGKLVIAELFAATADQKLHPPVGVEGSKVRVTYQIPTEVEWNGATATLCGRTLEEAFGLENAVWCQAVEQRYVGLKLTGELDGPAALAAGLHKRVKGKAFDKTKFALGILTAAQEAWTVPLYIKEGLIWLRDQVALEIDVVPDEAIAIDMPEATQ
jgi:predicted ATP-dependent endonuclease of OLD family